MPADFEKCVQEGGKVRTVSGPDHEHGLKRGQYVHYCIKDSTSYRGEVKTKKTAAHHMLPGERH